MSASVILITGATRGIGAAAAVELARRGAEVAIVGREPERVRATAEAARAAGGGAPVHEHVADLLRMDEVRRLAGEVLERHEQLDVLANNAGAMFTSRQVTPDGFERTFALNHAAGFLLTELLRERLAGGRVIMTASDAHTSGALDLDDLQFERRPFRPIRVYGTSKLMNILYTRELARRAPELTAACFHPGVVRTGFGKNDGLLYKIGLTVAGPFLRSPAKGARSLVWLALDADPALVNGAYVEDEQVATPSAAARDYVLAEGLWERTSELVDTLDGQRDGRR
jgi:NAD(P)-dependent dehydrogenase (short-subunit alcohol dehydrogenase family)